MNIVEELNQISTTVEQDCTATDVIKAIYNLLGEIILKDNTECEKLTVFEYKIRELLENG